jgi:hypothetical protein
MAVACEFSHTRVAQLDSGADTGAGGLLVVPGIHGLPFALGIPPLEVVCLELLAEDSGVVTVGVTRGFVAVAQADSSSSVILAE